MPALPFGQFSRTDSPPVDSEEDKVVMNPKTPFDFVLHTVFIRFVTLAERKIDNFLRYSLDQNPLLPDFMGSGVDSKFDEVLQSLARSARPEELESCHRFHNAVEEEPE